MVGCANVAGLSDLELVDSDCVGPSCGSAGAGAQGGSGGGGGASGSGGAGGKSGASGGGAGGAAGKSGAAGAAGAAGMSGAAGKSGASGMAGAAGMSGASGMAGAAGKAGAAGMGGVAGAAGKAGSGGLGGSGGSGGKAGSGGSGGNQAGSAGIGGSGGGGTGGGGIGGMAGSAGSGGGCVPATCADLGRDCGTLPDDGCGNPLDCGSCMGNLTCGKGGYANICGCAAGEYFCNGDDLVRCADSGAATYLVAKCAPGACNAGAGKCDSCVDGTSVCSIVGTTQTLNTCVGGATLTPKQVCLTGQICDPKGGGQCDKCVEGALSCLGTNLRKCSADGQAFATIATCDTDDLCKKTAQLGLTTCLKPLCQPKQMRCSGAQPQMCNALQDGWDNMGSACATADLCSAGVCATPACDVGETKCTGNVLQTCNAGRTGFDSMPCAQPNPICDIGGCVHRGPTMTKIDDGSVQPYYIDSTEVTNDQYNAFLDATVTPQSVTKSPAFCAWNTTYGAKNTTDPGNVPVSKIDWCDAYAYCAWAGKRLCGKIGGGPVAPSDVTNKSLDQWHLACVGITNTVYPYGNAYVPTACNTQDKGVGASLPVGTEPDCDSSFGNVLDLSGNVAEWEDSCSGTSGENDTCRARGGSYTGGEMNATCGFIGTVIRNVSTAKNIGIRCCAD